MQPIRILIADDHAIIRMGLASLLGTQKDIEVVGEAEDGEVAVTKASKLIPDIVIMDLMMPKKDGVAATKEIHKSFPNIKILILTSYGTSDGIAHALAAGASGALMKSTEFAEFVTAIRKIAIGERVIAPEISRQLAEDPPVPMLTQRQTEILLSITRGLTNSDIAKQFGIREDSVKEHTSTIFAKLGASNRSEAVAIALRKHLLKM
jgi:DNA-binding NarL/FixJ family response regulator